MSCAKREPVDMVTLGGKYRPGKEVPEVDELAVSLILDVNHAPAVFASTDWLAVDENIAL